MATNATRSGGKNSAKGGSNKGIADSIPSINPLIPDYHHTPRLITYLFSRPIPVGKPPEVLRDQRVPGGTFVGDAEQDFSELTHIVTGQFAQIVTHDLLDLDREARVSFLLSSMVQHLNGGDHGNNYGVEVYGRHPDVDI
ncbi:hypothetical protein [Dactylosporangium sp. CA-092794]|uniref:hypothetical protein n=1 Tax=Dactylosporangium sp. CA-092794 TaxID=3239929 RepID=UPI003D94C4FF